MKGDGAMRLVMSQLTQAREMAITQRRTMELKFVGGAGGNWLQVVRHEVPGTGTTTLSSVAFEGNVGYRLISSVTTDTPDGFGVSGAALLRNGHNLHVFKRRHVSSISPAIR